jgi:FkbM family methyltransferase
MGYEVRQFTPLRSLDAARRELFERRSIDLVLDVGANAGQYGARLRREGYRGRLVSLEPLAEPYEALRRRAEADGAWTALRVAASDADGEVVLQVTEDSRSASVLARNERFAGTPGWAPRGEERAPARRLAGLAPELLRAGERPYLKLDVQGYEAKAIEGATETLRQTAVVEAEVSLVELYEGQILMADFIALLRHHDFYPFHLAPEFKDLATGELLQLNGWFVRP